MGFSKQLEPIHYHDAPLTLFGVQYLLNCEYKRLRKAGIMVTKHGPGLFSTLFQRIGSVP